MWPSWASCVSCHTPSPNSSSSTPLTTTPTSPATTYADQEFLLMPCFHVICESDECRGRVYRGGHCPSCSDQITTPMDTWTKLRPSDFIGNKPLTCTLCIRKGVAVKFCPNCDKLLCGICSEHHPLLIPFSNHTPKPIEEMEMKPLRQLSKCGIHGDFFVTKYCRTHGELHCDECIKGQDGGDANGGCDVIELEDAVGVVRDEFEQVGVAVRSLLTTLTDRHNSIETELTKSLKLQHDALVTGASAMFSTLLARLFKREEQVREEITRATAISRARILAKGALLKKRSRSLKQFASFVECLGGVAKGSMVVGEELVGALRAAKSALPSQSAILDLFSLESLQPPPLEIQSGDMKKLESEMRNFCKIARRRNIAGNYGNGRFLLNKKMAADEENKMAAEEEEEMEDEEEVVDPTTEEGRRRIQEVAAEIARNGGDLVSRETIQVSRELGEIAREFEGVEGGGASGGRSGGSGGGAKRKPRKEKLAMIEREDDGVEFEVTPQGRRRILSPGTTTTPTPSPGKRDMRKKSLELITPSPRRRKRRSTTTTTTTTSATVKSEQETTPKKRRRRRRRKEEILQDGGEEDGEDLKLIDPLKTSLDSDHEDYCSICRDGGDNLLCCDACPKIFHLDCHLPPLSQVPEGTFQCNFCRPMAEALDITAMTRGDFFVKRSSFLGDEDYFRACKFLSEIFLVDCDLEVGGVVWGVARRASGGHPDTTSPFLKMKRRLMRDRYKDLEALLGDVKTVMADFETVIAPRKIPKELTRLEKLKSKMASLLSAYFPNAKNIVSMPVASPTISTATATVATGTPTTATTPMETHA